MDISSRVRPFCWFTTILFPPAIAFSFFPSKPLFCSSVIFLSLCAVLSSTVLQTWQLSCVNSWTLASWERERGGGKCSWDLCSSSERGERDRTQVMSYGLSVQHTIPPMPTWVEVLRRRTSESSVPVSVVCNSIVLLQILNLVYLKRKVELRLTEMIIHRFGTASAEVGGNCEKLKHFTCSFWFIFVISVLFKQLF